MSALDAGPQAIGHVRREGERSSLSVLGQPPAEYQWRPVPVDALAATGAGRREAEDDREGLLLGAITGALMASGPLDVRREALLRDLANALGLSAAVLWLPRDDVLVARTTWAGEDRDAQALAARVGADPVSRGVGLVGAAWELREPLYQTQVTEREADGGRPSPTGALWALTAVPAHVRDEVLGVLELYAPFRANVSPVLPALSPAAHLLGSVLDRWRLQEPLSKLTGRELELLTLASHGLTTSKIADRLSLSPWTVKTHFEHIRVKLGVGDRTAAVAKSLRAGTIA